MQVDLLEVIEEFVGGFGVNMTVIKTPDDEIGDFDLGIRKTFMEEGGIGQTVRHLYSFCREGILYFLNDCFEMEYCLFRIPKEEGQYGEMVLVGPYQKEYVDEYQLNMLVQSHKIPMGLMKELQEYYNAVPVMLLYEPWLAVLTAMAGKLYGGREMEIVRRESIDEYGDMNFFSNPPAEPLAAKLIEERYKAEEELLAAIAQGNMEKALKVHGRFRNFHIAKRYKDPARNFRNLMITANTLYRKAAQAGCVHPVHIDESSCKFAKKIETLMTKTEADRFNLEMIRKYCMLVRNYSLQGYSPLVQKVVNHIDLNLMSDLSLRNLAAEYCVNPSYLSSLFKKEMSVTITAYVNQQRMKQAIRYLNTSNMQIQNIAADVGISDVNYFSKLFKKATGKTPSEYRELILVRTQL